MKRLFDIIMSITGIILTFPLMILIWIMVRLTSPGPAIFYQVRVGQNNRDFKIIKFRTMFIHSDQMGLLTSGNDQRITPLGSFLRKFRLDEIPQFFNILSGTMSFVGPRPEVRKYVAHYTPDQMRILDYKPGVTDYACLLFIDLENKILHNHRENMDEVYIREIMPKKIAANLNYFVRADFFSDLGIMIKTIVKTFNTSRI